MTRCRKLSTTLMVLTATAFAGVAVAIAAPQGGGPTVVTTDGPVRGIVKNGVNTFLGIPYAAPPVGALRWMPPQPPAKHALLDATQYANTCPQVTELGAFAGPTSTTEDCLYLNVFTTGTGGAPKPVFVWIHGGGDVDGETNDYDGSKLATGGPLGTPTVVVSMNYRLGMLGFLSHPALDNGNAWGNYGILDIQQVLRWVQANISAFGGDPTNVTLGGQSAGASNTVSNLLSPGAAGLFQRAIIESWPQATFPTEAVALQRGEAFAAAAGCPGTGASAAECLRQLSAARVLQLQGTPNANGPYLIEHFVDGNVIAVQPGVGFATGAYNKMPIMTGSVKDENTFFLMITEYFSGPPQVALTPAQYLANKSAAVLAQYPLSDYGGNPTLAQDRVGTDPIKCVTLQGLTQIASTNTYGTYGYDFTYRGAPSYFPQMPNAYDPTGDFQALAYHTSDIQFLFPGYHGGNLGVNLDQTSGQPRDLQGAEVTLSDQLVAAWTNFAKTGNPNGTGVPVWPVFTTGSPVFLQEDIPNGLETEAQYVANYKCDFWGF